MEKKQRPVDTTRLLGQIHEDIAGIKRLLVLFLIKSGATQAEVGLTLGVTQKTISTWFKDIKIKKFGEGD